MVALRRMLHAVLAVVLVLLSEPATAGTERVAEELNLNSTRLKPGVWEVDLEPLLGSAASELVVRGMPPLHPGGPSMSLTLRRRESVDDRVVVDVRSDRLPAAAPLPSTRSWSGSIAGEPRAAVFISAGPAGTFGWIEHQGRRWSISSGPASADAKTIVLHPDCETARAIDWAIHECDTPALDRPPISDRSPFTRTTRGGDSCLEPLIAIETDNEFLSRFDGDVQAALGYVETLVAAADFVMERDLGGGLRLGFVRLWETQDPWIGESTSERLGEFRTSWIENDADIERDTAHFLSGAGLGGGRAWVIGAIDPMLGSYAISGNLNGYFPYPVVSFDAQNWDIFVFLHELGHLLGSPHTHAYDPRIDGCGFGDCSSAVGGTIMSYCHLCSGGYSNIDIAFHPIVQNRIVEFRTFDSDEDGFGDTCDRCREDPFKVDPGICGCGRPDVDADGDGQMDCLLNDFNVPDDFPTLAAALDAAVPGAVITLAPGVWPTESSIEISRRQVTIRGTRGPDGSLSTILSSMSGERVLSFTADCDESTVVQDLRFEGDGVEIGGGIEVFDGSPTFRGCEFVGNRATRGGAVCAIGWGSVGPVFEGCHFIGNSSVEDGGAVHVRVAIAASFIDSTFALNRAGTFGDLAFNWGSEPMVFSDCVVCGHESEPIRGPMWIDAGCASGGCRDTDSDGIVDDCGGGASCPADVDFDGRVRAADLGLVFMHWGATWGFQPADVDRDGWVDVSDVASILTQWGECPR